MSVGQGNFEFMTQARFRIHQATNRLTEVELSADQNRVAVLPANAIAVVYGSPGSGKTLALQARFRRLVDDGLNPAQILALSATRDSANYLRDQLALDLQSAVPGALAKTLPSFAFAIIRAHAVASGGQLPQLISGAEQDRILMRLLETEVEERGSQDSLWPNNYTAQVLGLAGFRAELRDLLSVCQEHGISPEGLARLGAEHGKPEWQATAKIFASYLAALSDPSNQGRLDSASLLDAARQLLIEDASLADSTSLSAILVDDAQELTPAASRFLATLVEASGAGLVLLGDPDSATLAFRSADPTGMRNLVERLASQRATSFDEIFLQPQHAARPVGLGVAMGRVARQIDAARAGRQRKALSPQIEIHEDASVQGAVFLQPSDEVAWLARQLRELHLYQGVPFSDMAVVARSSSNLERLAIELVQESVPVEVAASSVGLRDEFAAYSLLTLLQHCLQFEPVSVERAIELLQSPICGLDAIGLRRLRRALRREELSADGTRNSDQLLVALFDAVGSVAVVKSAEGKKVDQFLRIIAQVRQLVRDATAEGHEASIEDLLWVIFNGSKLDSRWQEAAKSNSEVGLQANRNLNATVALFAAANRYAERNPNGSPIDFVSAQLSLGLPEDTLAQQARSVDSVKLMTPAKLIGRRFKVIALPGLIEGVWPNLRPRSSLLGATALDSVMSGRIENIQINTRSELPDELRMLYKSVGAASERLIVSATQSEEQQVSQFVTLLLGQVPPATAFNGSRLSLRSIAGGLRRNLALAIQSNRAGEATESAYLLAQLSVAGVPGANPNSWYGARSLSTVEPLVNIESGEELVSISPSKLENFNKCPLHWFLSSHGASESTFAANLGTLMHSAIENFLAESDSAANEAKLWSLVESKWHTLTFEAEWLEQAAKRKAKQMTSNLVQYLRQFEAEGATVIGSELSFSFNEGQANIRGQIDRVELHPDGRVIVIDLKTGKHQFTAKEADAHAQLAMYQLAFEAGALDEAMAAALSRLGLSTELSQLQPGGAKLVLVGGDKLVEREQSALAGSPIREQFIAQIAAATKGMADQVFVAQVDSHCQADNQYGSCSLHLIEAVSYVG